MSAVRKRTGAALCLRAFFFVEAAMTQSSSATPVQSQAEGKTAPTVKGLGQVSYAGACLLITAFDLMCSTREGPLEEGMRPRRRFGRRSLARWR